MYGLAESIYMCFLPISILSKAVTMSTLHDPGPTSKLLTHLQIPMAAVDAFLMTCNAPLYTTQIIWKRLAQTVILHDSPLRWSSYKWPPLKWAHHRLLGLLGLLGLLDCCLLSAVCGLGLWVKLWIILKGFQLLNHFNLQRDIHILWHSTAEALFLLYFTF